MPATDIKELTESISMKNISPQAMALLSRKGWCFTHNGNEYVPHRMDEVVSNEFPFEQE